jgi:hypothetical protein
LSFFSYDFEVFKPVETVLHLVFCPTKVIGKGVFIYNVVEIYSFAAKGVYRNEIYYIFARTIVKYFVDVASFGCKCLLVFTIAVNETDHLRPPWWERKTARRISGMHGEIEKLALEATLQPRH